MLSGAAAPTTLGTFQDPTTTAAPFVQPVPGAVAAVAGGNTVTSSATRVQHIGNPHIGRASGMIHSLLTPPTSAVHTFNRS